MLLDLHTKSTSASCYLPLMSLKRQAIHFLDDTAGISHLPRASFYTQSGDTWNWPGCCPDERREEFRKCIWRWPVLVPLF